MWSKDNNINFDQSFLDLVFAINEDLKFRWLDILFKIYEKGKVSIFASIMLLKFKMSI